MPTSIARIKYELSIGAEHLARMIFTYALNYETKLSKDELREFKQCLPLIERYYPKRGDELRRLLRQ
jgi:hypothetical protein